MIAPKCIIVKSKIRKIFEINFTIDIFFLFLFGAPTACKKVPAAGCFVRFSELKSLDAIHKTKLNAVGVVVL